MKEPSAVVRQITIDQITDTYNPILDWLCVLWEDLFFTPIITPDKVCGEYVFYKKVNNCLEWVFYFDMIDNVFMCDPYHFFQEIEKQGIDFKQGSALAKYFLCEILNSR